MNEVRVLQDIVALERDPEEEPQRRDRLVHGRHTDAARRQTQLIAAHVLEARRVGRAAKKRREVLDPLQVVMLGLRRELADRHVFDHAPAQRAHRLVGHGDAPVLSEGLLTPHLQDRAPRPAIVLGTPVAAAPYRASGLVLWPDSDLPARPLFRRSWGRSGHQSANASGRDRSVRAPARHDRPGRDPALVLPHESRIS